MATWRSTGVAAACAGSDGSSGSFVLHEVVSELRGSVRFDATVDP